MSQKSKNKKGQKKEAAPLVPQEEEVVETQKLEVEEQQEQVQEPQEEQKHDDEPQEEQKQEEEIQEVERQEQEPEQEHEEQQEQKEEEVQQEEQHQEEAPQEEAQQEEVQQEEKQEEKQEEVPQEEQQKEEHQEQQEQHQEEVHDENKNVVDLFHAYDTQKTGTIKAGDLYEIAARIGKQSQSVEDVLHLHDKNKDDQINLDEYLQLVNELDRPNISAIRSEHSRTSHSQSQRVVITPDPKVIEFIKLLYAFQKKCEQEGKYNEAKLSQHKIEEIKTKEMLRQENNIRAFQEEEFTQVENAQKDQFIEFNRVWDGYMADYEKTALESLEKLKEKHIKEVEELHERLRGELAFHFKSSKQLIELRQKEQALVKMKKYGEAEKIRSQAENLEEWERNNKEKEIGEIIDKKTAALRKQQQRSLTVLLKRIQKDRNQQLKNREQDSQKLIQKNKNLRTELLAKHTTEAKNAIEVIRSNLSGLHYSVNIQNSQAQTPTVLRKSVVQQ